MRYVYLFLLSLVSVLSYGQNPLKKALRGNSQSVYYSPSQFQFTNQKDATIFISELRDRRSLNWNKQVNDSVRIEAIGDFWNFPMGILFKNKLNQDFSKANLNVVFSEQGANVFKIEPTLEALYPDFHSYPDKGYWVLSKINMTVTKGGQRLFSKSYQEYTFFSNKSANYDASFNKDLKAGANVAMWSSIKRLLDQFYGDLNSSFAGKSVQSSDIALHTISKASNIANDASLNKTVSNYSTGKTETPANTNASANNYKMIDGTKLPPPTDDRLTNAVKTVLKSKEEKEPSSKNVKKKSNDSTTKSNSQSAKLKLQSVKDSILKAKRKAIAEKVAERKKQDSIKKAEINAKITLAKKKKEAEKAKKKALLSKKEKQAQPRTKVISKSEDETIGEAVKRIAKEVEAEENGQKIVYKESSQAKARKYQEELAANRKAAKEKALAEKKQRDALLAANKKRKRDSLMAIRVEKAKAIEIAMKKAKAAKDSMKKVAAMNKYVQDSIQLVRNKEARRKAVLAAQKAALDLEKETLLKNPHAGNMFATVSSDPPNKMPDNRTREEKLADRVFKPSSEEAKRLLSRVKLITPAEEANMLAQMKTDDKSSVDSFFIQVQRNRPIPTYTPLDNDENEKKDGKATKDKKAEIIAKGLKNAKSLKEKESSTEETTSSKKTTEQPPVEKTISNIEETKPSTETKEVSDEKKAKDLEDEIERKTRELKEKLKKAKAW